jgi:hypothetical protein
MTTVLRRMKAEKRRKGKRVFTNGHLVKSLFPLEIIGTSGEGFK